MRLLSKISLWSVVLFCCLPAQSQHPVLSFIESGDAEQLSLYLAEHDINAPVNDHGLTLLVHAIRKGEAGTVQFLLEKGADPEQFVEDRSPLMHAVETGELKKVRLMVEAGAKLEAVDPEGNTALLYAGVVGQKNILRFLIRKEANLFHKNNDYLTTNDLAVRSGHVDLGIYIRSQMEKNLPDMHDGPYVHWSSNRRLKALYITHDGESQQTRKRSESFRVREHPFLMKGFSEDTLDYLIYRRAEIPPDEFEVDTRILVIGDIHGGYDSLIHLLRHNKVIDADHDWSFGRGQVVFLGDIFDRGYKVTEALWLIYQMEHQARMAGGNVHLILGNHEILVLTGNIDYISDKYRITTEKLNLGYHWLYRKRTVLGQWLRTRNTMVSINDYLFVHAGISPRIASMGWSIREINDMVRYFLRHPSRMEYRGIDRQAIFSSTGPFWYRGYHENNHERHQISEEQFKKVIQAFPAKKIFIGHTNVPEITSIFNDRVYALDVPFYTPGYNMQAMLIEKDQLFLVNTHDPPTRIESF